MVIGDINMKVSICDGCLRSPEPFFSDSGRELWFVILDKDGEATHLMSDLEFKFLASEERFPIREKGRTYFCVDCIEKMNNIEEI